MSTFFLQSLHLSNFRGFESLDLAFDPQLTLLFAENGGGKTAALAATAMALGLLQRSAPLAAKLLAGRDLRNVVIDDVRQPAGSCLLRCVAQVDGTSVEWRERMTVSGTKSVAVREARVALDRVRVPGTLWPLLASYGTARLARASKAGRPRRLTRDRWDGYQDSLDPAATDGPLLHFLATETLGDLQRLRRGEPERRRADLVFAAQVRAAPSIRTLEYDVVEESVVARFQDGSHASWEELSDGYHVYLGLVGDIARRAFLLNEFCGNAAIEQTPGVVLIDEIDLHLHPRWQRLALSGLRAAFPAMQFVVTTHSPQVLSSARNEQVRLLRDGKVIEGLNVEGRDTNSILRELMETDERDEEGVKTLGALYAAIDSGELELARRQVETLRQRWGPLDPEFIRAEGMVQEAEEERRD